FVWARMPPARRMSRSRGVITHEAVKRALVRALTTVTLVPAASDARRPSKTRRSSRSIPSQAAGSSNTSGTTPQLMRFARWMRAKDLASTTRTPRNIGAMAATSREEPWPYVSPATSTPRPAALARATNSSSTYLKECSAMAGTLERKTSTAAPAGENGADARDRAAGGLGDERARGQQVGQQTLARHRLEDAMAAREEHERDGAVHALTLQHAVHRGHVVPRAVRARADHHLLDGL